MLKMQKGCNRGRRYHNARCTAIEARRWDLMERPSVIARTFKGGISGWLKSWPKTKPSAFEYRFRAFYRHSPQFANLPVRHPRIRLERPE